jgi:hypothetical protein
MIGFCHSGVDLSVITIEARHHSGWYV